jgi:ADP-heptose:LPS heptosyltransferase
MNSDLMSKIDWYFGVPLCYLFGLVHKTKGFFIKKKDKKIEKILVVKFFGLGSIVLSAPSIIALKDKYPGVKIYFLSFLNNKAVFDILNLTDKNYFIDSTNFKTFIFSFLKTIASLRKEKIDLSIDLEFFAKFPLIVSTLAGVKKKAGFYLTMEPWRISLLDYRGYYNHYWHVKDIFLSLIYLIKEQDQYYLNFNDYKNKYVLPKLEFAEEKVAGLKEKLKKFGWQDEKIILINPNAGKDLATKIRKWPDQYFSELSDLLIKKLKRNYIIIYLGGNNEEKEMVKNIIGSITKKDNFKVLNLANELNLTELLVLFNLADLFITIDSGPMHLAALSRVPIIGLFFGDTPVLFGPLTEKYKIVFNNAYCQPLYTVYNGKRALVDDNILARAIKPEQVFNLCLDFLN